MSRATTERKIGVDRAPWSQGQILAPRQTQTLREAVLRVMFSGAPERKRWAVKADRRNVTELTRPTMLEFVAKVRRDHPKEFKRLVRLVTTEQQQGLEAGLWWAVVRHRRGRPVLFDSHQAALANRSGDEYLVRVRVTSVLRTQGYR